MMFKYQNGIEVWMFEDPIEKDKICLFASRDGESIDHGSTLVTPDQLASRLHKLENFSYLTADIEIDVDY